MRTSLNNSLQIARLAADLGLHHRRDYVAAILELCHERVNAVLKEFGCSTLSELVFG